MSCVTWMSFLATVPSLFIYIIVKRPTSTTSGYFEDYVCYCIFKHRINIQSLVPGSVEEFAAVIIIIIISCPSLPREFPVKPTMIHGVNSFIPGSCLMACRGALGLIASYFYPSLWRDAFTSFFFALRH